MASEVTLKVSGLRERSGELMIAVFDSENQFPDKEPVQKTKINVESSHAEVSVKLKLEPGTYAISMFLDENRNGKLDKNVLGIPKELFGFSNNPSIMTGPPDYKDCEIEVKENGQSIDIKLKKML